MNFFKRSFLHIVLLLFILSACLPKRLTGEETGEPGVKVPPVDLATPSVTGSSTTLPAQSTSAAKEMSDTQHTPGEDEVLLWAVESSASSSAGGKAYHPSQALGKPDTLACGDYVTAWQPSEDEYEAWIELDYSPHILPNGIHIVQSYHPAQISKVEVLTLDEETITVFDAVQEDLAFTKDCPASRYISLPQIDVLIRSVRITLQRNAGEAWTQIDAVGVMGFVGEALPEAPPAQEWIDEDEPEDFYQPRFFSNKNRINTILFAGDFLWAGGDGGIVAWDLSDINAPQYVHASPIATHALAFCDFEEPVLVAGGDKGVYTLSPPYYTDYGPYFQLLEHPGDEYFGPVSALGCDNDLQQIWVGYGGHLSRNDMISGNWKEFSVDDGIPGDSVRQIRVIDVDIWVATAAGVAVLQGDRLKSAYTPENSEIPSRFVHALASDESATMWMASSDGLISYDGQAWKLWSSDEIDGGPMTQVMMGLRADQSGNLWLADFFGTICKFIPGWNTCRQIILPPEDFNWLHTFDIDQSGRLAVGSLTDGLWLYADETWIPLRTRDQALSNALRALAYTPDGQIWLAGVNSLQRFQSAQPAAPWESVPLPPNANPFSLHVASDGIWIGYTGGASFIPYLEGEEIINIPMTERDPGIDNTVTAISRDASGRVYFGLSTGLRIWDGSDLRYEDLRSDAERAASTLAPWVNVIHADGESVWVGSSRGLFRFVNGEQKTAWKEELQNTSSFYSSSVGVIIPSPRGNGLLVSIGRELFFFDRGSFSRVLQLPGKIVSVFPGPYQLWLATANSGFFSVPMDDTPDIYWDMPSKYEELPDHFGYQSITMSDPHTLWIASSKNGLIRIKALFGQ